MSWWDTKNLTSFATQALKTAQKRIDKVLDINEDTDGNPKSLMCKCYAFFFVYNRLEMTNLFTDQAAIKQCLCLI